MWDTAGEVGTNISDVLLWTASHGQAKAERPARTYIQQSCADTGHSRKQWTIEKGGGKRSEIYVLIARHDDDDDDVYMKILFVV